MNECTLKVPFLWNQLYQERLSHIFADFTSNFLQKYQKYCKDKNAKEEFWEFCLSLISTTIKIPQKFSLEITFFFLESLKLEVDSSFYYLHDCFLNKSFINQVSNVNYVTILPMYVYFSKVKYVYYKYIQFLCLVFPFHDFILTRKRDKSYVSNRDRQTKWTIK